MNPKVCVVCGAASHRVDWINKQGGFVACDSHSAGEFQRAIAVLQQATPAPASTTPAPAAPAAKTN